MKGKYSKKKENKEVEFMNQEETKEKKKMPKWLKIGLGIAGGVVAAGGAYILGEHKGASSSSEESDEDFDDDFFDEEDNN